MKPIFSVGHTLVELIVVIAIVAVLMGLAAQNYRAWVANSQIRTATETLVEGLSAARNEAIRRNRQITFHLVDDLSEDCAASSSGTSWVVSEDDPAGKCHVEMSETKDPFIVAKKAGGERTATVTIAAQSATGGEASAVAFNGVGRVVLLGNTPIARIDVDSAAIGKDESRDLRITVSSGGMVRMCDPDAKITDPTDPRKCP